tara:strand:- start:3527 stop:3817 length:291 start_codon:yes stop_codon:yes gene_type:complete
MEKTIELKNTIENMSKYHQLEILRILSSDSDVCINENKNGTFINLTEQKAEIIEQLKKYCIYVEEQQKSLEYQEKEKQRLQNTYFKEDKDVPSSKI